MKRKIETILIAKIIAIIYILFISLFAFDTPLGIGFLIHLFPTIIFLGTLIVTWKKPKIAGILFFLEGLGTILVFNTYRDLFVFLAVSIVPVLIGILFFFSKNPKH